MSNQVIVQSPHPALSTVCDAFTQEEFDQGLPATLAQDLIDTLKSVIERGVGLSANQIAVTKRMFIMKRPKSDDFYVFVNPKLNSKKKGKTTISKGEGCLSVEQLKRYDVPRYNKVVVDFLDVNGVEQRLQFRGFEAFVIQHELDHLNGLMINDNDGQSDVEEKEVPEEVV